MSVRPISLGVLALFGLCLPAGTALGADPKPRVVIVEPRPVDLPGVGPRALRAAVADGLNEAGIEIVPPSEVDAAGLACADAACRRKLAESTHATEIVEVDAAAASRDDFDLKLHVFDASSGDELGGDSLLCNVCLAKELLARAKDMAGIAWGHAAKTKALRAQAATVSNPVVPPKPVVPLDPQPPAPAVRPAWERAIPIGGIVAGAGLAGWGIYLLASDGKEACDYQPCALVHADKRRGTILAGAGGLLAAVGVGALIYQWHDDSIAVGVGPSTVALSGRF